MDNFTVITPTGDRPEAFKLCCHYIKRQTIKPTEWIIIDDGNIKLNIPDWSFIKYIKRQKSNTEPEHTLSVQLLEAFNQIKYNKIIMMEDDDWYANNYLSVMNDLLDGFCLVGIKNNIYYKITEQRYIVRSNSKWSCLCSSAFRNSIVKYIINDINKNPNTFLIDSLLWQNKNITNKILIPNTNLCVGIKALPGRKGKCMGHNDTKNFISDTGFSFLKNIIGNDVLLYKPFMKEQA